MKGIWLNRDPKDEIGFKLVCKSHYRKTLQQLLRAKKRPPEGDCVFVANDPINKWDLLGLDWHHLLPKAIFETLKIVGVDIHSAEYGWDLPTDIHTGKGGLHPSGWNPDWAAWVEAMEEEGKTITKADVDCQLAVMKKKYAKFLKHGSQATTRWPGENSYKSKIKKKMGVTSLLFLASIAAGELTGRNAELAVELQEALENYGETQDDFIDNIDSSVEIATLLGELFGTDPDLAAAALLK